MPAHVCLWLGCGGLRYGGRGRRVILIVLRHHWFRCARVEKIQDLLVNRAHPGGSTDPAACCKAWSGELFDLICLPKRYSASSVGLDKLASAFGHPVRCTGINNWRGPVLIHALPNQTMDMFLVYWYNWGVPQETSLRVTSDLNLVCAS